MNAKVAKLLRQYCKKYNRDYKLYKKTYKSLSAEKQFEVLSHLRGAISD
jgi:hypothetical protein